MSPDSDFYVTTTFSNFLSDNFDQQWPVNYSNLDMKSGLGYHVCKKSEVSHRQEQFEIINEQIWAFRGERI